MLTIFSTPEEQLAIEREDLKAKKETKELLEKRGKGNVQRTERGSRVKAGKPK
jgi:hypothetical protein